MDERELYEKGMAVRQEVFGVDYVKRFLANRTDFNQEFQELITRYCWGEIWSRPGLPRHTRSLVILAMLVALNREAELQLHLRGAANNGVTREEIKEVLLQATIYCGVPAGNTAFQIAARMFAEQDEVSR